LKARLTSDSGLYDTLTVASVDCICESSGALPSSPQPLPGLPESDTQPFSPVCV